MNAEKEKRKQKTFQLQKGTVQFNEPQMYQNQFISYRIQMVLIPNHISSNTKRFKEENIKIKKRN